MASRRTPTAGGDTPAPKPAPTPAPAGMHGTIRVRMYRVGFGDCFLLTLPGPPPHHVLIDCGVHSQGDVGTIADAVADIAAVTGKQLDLVIATHAHQDHISGFGKCAELFRQFTVKEVWLPWTEDPNDIQATQLRQKREAVTNGLRLHMAAVGTGGEALAALNNLVGNEPALRQLHGGFAGARLRYLVAGTKLDDFTAIPGLTTRVLGPPRDQAFLGRMDPPSGDRFLRAAAGGGTEPANPVRPFEDLWSSGTSPFAPELLPAGDIKALGDMASDPESLAFALTSAMNNTSIVVLFSFRGRNLLFPGDAQYGNWQSWIDDPQAQAILAQVNFYKVAHHGSVNATPRRAVQGMPQGDFAAMVSTQNKPWPSIPYGDLIAALIGKSCGVARSDTISVPNFPGANGVVTPPVFTPGRFWYDYEIPI